MTGQIADVYEYNGNRYNIVAILIFMSWGLIPYPFIRHVGEVIIAFII
ncbi:hypothetical protein [Enterocloster bolteae]|nr:hypothetical protein [Enterocloster bolteae]